MMVSKAEIDESVHILTNWTTDRVNELKDNSTNSTFVGSLKGVEETIALWSAIINGLLAGFGLLYFMCAKFRLPGLGMCLLFLMDVFDLTGSISRYQLTQEKVIVLPDRYLDYDVASDYSSLFHCLCLLLMIMSAMLLTGHRKRDRHLRYKAYFINAGFILAIIGLAVLGGVAQQGFYGIDLDFWSSQLLSPSFIIAMLELIGFLLIWCFKNGRIENVTEKTYKMPDYDQPGSHLPYKLKAYNGMIMRVFWVLAISACMNVCIQAGIIVINYLDDDEVMGIFKTISYAINYFACTISIYIALKPLPRLYGHS